MLGFHPSSWVCRSRWLAAQACARRTDADSKVDADVTGVLVAHAEAQQFGLPSGTGGSRLRVMVSV